MKKLVKSLLVGVLAFAIVLAANTSVMAAESQSNADDEGITFLYDDGEGNHEVSTRARAECGRYPTHDMLSRGWGTIRKTNGQEVVYMGACHQCTRCNLVLICQGEPECSSIGYYATYMAEGPVNTITVLTTNNILYTSAKTIPGMDFRY